MRATFIIAAASVAALLTGAGPAQSQANRTFVSGSGSDSNPCSLAAPCRSFAGAITQTNAGGEIVALDSAGYGAVTITKSISINAPDGIEGGITTSSATDAIIISVSVSDVVNLRGLTLIGGGVGSVGVLFNAGGALNIQNCVIRGFTNTGILLVPTGNATFNISDTIVSGIGSSGNGITLQPSGTGTVTAVWNRVQAIGDDIGLLVDGSGFNPGVVIATIANSTASNNLTGVTVEGASGAANTQVMVVNSVVSNNGTGIFEEGGNSTTYLAKNAIAGNSLAFNVLNSGALFSFGDNYIKSNANDGGAITLVTAK